MSQARELEAFLDDPLRNGGPLTFRQAVLDDQQRTYPAAALDALGDWGYRAYQVPRAFGGRLESLEELAALGRVIARRDPTVAILANSAWGASMPVWLAGTTTQRAELSRSIHSGEAVALGITEHEHGADLLASEVTGRRTDSGDYVVNGAKWLINNVRRARHVCLLVREPERSGPRSLTFLLVDLRALPATACECLDRIETHGVRGADIAGIRFHDAKVPASAVVGRAGRGLELAAAALLVTRTLVPSLSLGVLDTALGCVGDFVRGRRLYGATAADIPFVREELAAAALDLWVAETIAACCVRVLHVLPGLAPVSAAAAKFLLPHLVEARMRRLATVLGARHFVAEGHWFGIFEKLWRDVRLFGLFDGSEPVVRSALAVQASCLAGTEADAAVADRVFDASPIDTAGGVLGPFELVAEADPVMAGAAQAGAALGAAGQPAAADVLRSEVDGLRTHAARPVDPRSLSGQQLGERYARVFGAVCLIRSWSAGAPVFADDRISSADRVAAGVMSLLRPGARMPRPLADALFSRMLQPTAGTAPDETACRLGS